MNALISGAAPQTMTSREIADLTGKEHRHVLRDVEVMLEQLEIPIEGYAQNWTHPQNGMTYIEYVLPKDLTLTLVSGYNVVLRKRIIDRWQELETAVANPLAHLPPEQRALVAVMIDNAAIKAKQAEQAQAIAQIETRVEEVAQTQLLTSRPAASESITHMRPRAAKMFGLPERVVEQVIRQSPIAPRPAGMVKNDRAEAEGSSYAVYWIKDVNDVLRRFVGECRMVTAAFAEHPYIEGRFKLAKGGAA